MEVGWISTETHLSVFMTPTIRLEPHKVSVPGLLLCLLMHSWLWKGRRCNLIYETDFQVGRRSWGLRMERGRDPELQALTTGATIINRLYCAATPQLAALPLTDGFMLPSSSPHTLYCQLRLTHCTAGGSWLLSDLADGWFVGWPWL